MKHNQTIFSLVGFAFFLFLGIQIVTVTVMTLIIQRVAPSIMTASWYSWAISYIPLYGVAFPTMYAFMKKTPDSPFTPEQNKPSGKIMAALSLVCLSIMFLFAIITNVITALISLLTHSTLTNSLETAISESNVFLSFLIIGIIAPIMEEIVFRGLTYKKLGAYGSKTYVLTSALIFALFHTNIYQFIYTFLLGIIFAFITYKTGTIKYSTILHLIVNLSASGGLGLLVNYLGILPLATLYSTMVLAAIIGGIVIFVIGWLRYKSKLHFEVGPLSPPKARQVIFNPGMWLFILLTLVITIQNMLM